MGLRLKTPNSYNTLVRTLFNYLDCNGFITDVFYSHIESEEVLMNEPGPTQCLIVQQASCSIVYNYPEGRRGVAGENSHCSVVV